MLLRILLAAAALFVHGDAFAKDGRFPPSGISSSIGRVETQNTSEWTVCSLLEDPPFTPVSVTTADDLHDVVTANCENGCILELAAGTYDDTNVTVGPSGDANVKADSLDGVDITGEIVIRAADPSNKPVLRAAIGNPAGAFYFVNNTKMVRVENVIVDGRRSEQTADAVIPCTDTTPEDGICDTGSQTQTVATGFYTNSSNGTKTRTCLLNVEVRDSINDGFEIRDGIASTIENSTVSGVGCTTSTCPAMDVPADNVTESVLLVARGANFIESSVVGVINSSFDDATKSGIQCFGSSACFVVGNTITNVASTGIVVLGSSASVRNNRIENVGLNYPPNATSDNTGHGIHFVDSTDYTGDLVADFTSNVAVNTFAAGFRFELRKSPASESSIVSIQNNTSSGACNGSTRTDEASFYLGDPTDNFQAIYATGNRAIGSLCPASFFVQNADIYQAKQNVSTGGSGYGAHYYNGAVIDETGLETDADILVGSGASGSLESCVLNGAAGIAGAVEGAVTRTDCGPAQSGGGGSSIWGDLEWDADDWG